MKTYDWIVVGGGIAGKALSYELAKRGLSTLLLEQHHSPANATRYSYGGIAYWSGTTDLMRQLCAEGAARYRVLSEELDADTQFRELDLLLTIAADRDPQKVAESYAGYGIPPTLLSVDAACEMEPLLNREAIAGALTVRHGHVFPQAMARAYFQAFSRVAGMTEIVQVKGFTQTGDRITGVSTPMGDYQAANVAICAGGLSRLLLQAVGIAVPIFFTHAELIETPPVDVQLQTLVMPAEQKRFEMEAKASQVSAETWDEPGHEPASPILDAGVVQFLDGRLRIGQISRVLTDPYAQGDTHQSEAKLRAAVGQVLPTLQNLPGTWHHCLVGFSGDRTPRIGPLPGTEGIHLFSGFSNPFATLPVLAQRFAQWAASEDQEAIAPLLLTYR